MSSKAIKEDKEQSKRINNLLSRMDNGYNYLDTHLYQFFVLHVVPRT